MIHPTKQLTIYTLCLGLGLCEAFEFFSEWHIVEECPWIIELVVPGPFQILHGLYHSYRLLVTNQSKEGRIDTICALSAESVASICPP